MWAFFRRLCSYFRSKHPSHASHLPDEPARMTDEERTELERELEEQRARLRILEWTAHYRTHRREHNGP